jgi:hypothetical protein
MECYEFTPMLGPAEHLPVGSVEWSQRISHQLQIATDTVSYDLEHLVARCLKQVLSADPKPWAVWPEGKPFDNPDAWARAVTGHHLEVLVRIANEFGGTEFAREAALFLALFVASAAHADPMVCRTDAGVTHCEAPLRHFRVTGTRDGNRTYFQDNKGRRWMMIEEGARTTIISH